MPTPRDLDPKFKDAQVPENTDEYQADKPTEETDQETRLRLASTEIPKDPEEGQITYRQPYVDSAGNVGEKVHGPMPRSEWAAYSLKNGL